MRKFLLFLLIYFIFTLIPTLAETKIYSEKGEFGLKNSTGEIILKPVYKKMIPLGENSYIVQQNSKFGLIDFNGNILVPIKYNMAERILGEYLKIGTNSIYGLYDSKGKEIIPIKYTTVDLLFGGMFLTCLDYKYGVVKNTGEVILENIYDEIYMPKPSLMRICYRGLWYEIEHKKGSELILPEKLTQANEEDDFVIKEILENPSVGLGYSAVSTADYLLKFVSSISPAHEKTIDELMLHKGVDTISILAKMTWIPKYPIVYIKHYYNTFRTPNNGPLSGIKYTLKQKI